MKRLLLVLCLITSLLCFSACGSSEKAEKPIDPQTETSLIDAAGQVFENGYLPFTDKAEMNAQYEAYMEDDEEVYANAMLAWQNAYDDMGAYIGRGDATVTRDKEKNYIITLTEKFEQRNLEFEMIVDKNITQITSMSINPEYTFGEKMVKAALNTVIGMCVVFVILIMIALIISLFKFIPAIQEKFSKKKAPAAAPAPAAPAAAPVVEEEEDEIDDLELVAVITAAIAASENTSADGLVVRSIKRAKTSGWKRA